MAKSLNKASLIGTLGRDAEVRFNPSGAAVTSFSLATEHSYKKGENYESETTWHDIVLWNSEKLSAYLLKGTKVFLEGRIQHRSYEDKDGQKKYRTEIVADPSSIVLLQSKQNSQSSSYSSNKAPVDDGQSDYPGDDVPF